MAWQDRLRRPSFRGVPFEVESSDLEGGRRLVVHEFPQQDKPYPEDMGRANRLITMQGFVVGDDYFRARNLLIEALETPGPGTLVHPHFGELTVSVDHYRETEGRVNGRTATFEMSFIESGEHEFPVSFLAPAAVLQASALDSITAFGAAFVAAWETSAPAWVLDAGADAIDSVVSQIRAAVLGPVAAASSIVADITDALDTITAASSSLAALPDDLVTALLGVMDQVQSIGPDALRTFVDLAGDAGAADVPATGGTAANATAAANETALNRYLVRGALAQACAAIASTTFDSYDSAIATRDTLADMMAAEDAAADGPSNLGELRGALVEDLTARAEVLARVRSLTPVAPLPAAVLAHQLYGDASRADEITDRNALAHPSFVPSGPVLVLSR